MSSTTPHTDSMPEIQDLYEFFQSSNALQSAQLLADLKLQHESNSLIQDNMHQALYYGQALLCALLTCNDIHLAVSYLDTMQALSLAVADACHTLSSFQDTFWSVPGYLLVFHLHAELRVVLNKLDELLKNGPENLSLASFYAELLGDLSRIPSADIDEGKEALDACERILAMLNPSQPAPWPETPRLADAYARILLGLSFYTSPSTSALSQEMLDKVRKLNDAFPNQHMVFLCYAKILVNHMMDAGYSPSDTSTISHIQQAFDKHAHNPMNSRHFADVLIEALSALTGEKDVFHIMHPYFEHIYTAPVTDGYMLLAEYVAEDLRKRASIDAYHIIKIMYQHFPTSVALHESSLDCLQMCLFSRAEIDIGSTIELLEAEQQSSPNPYGVKRLMLLALLCAAWDESISPRDKEDYAARLAQDASTLIHFQGDISLDALYQSSSFVEAWYRLSSWLPNAPKLSQGGEPSQAASTQTVKYSASTSTLNPIAYQDISDPSDEKEEPSTVIKQSQIPTRPSRAVMEEQPSSPARISEDKRKDNPAYVPNEPSMDPAPSYSRITKRESVASTTSLQSESTHESRVAKPTNASASPLASQRQRASLRVPVTSAMQYIIELPEKPQTPKYLSLLSEVRAVADVNYKTWMLSTEQQDLLNVRPLPTCAFEKTPSENSHKPH